MGFFSELFGDTPEGNYETKDTTTFVETLFGGRSAEVKDLRTDEVGRGKGDNARDAKSNAFHHLKGASSYDPNYTPGPEPEKSSDENDSSGYSGGSGGGYSGGSGGSSGGGGGGGSNEGCGGCLSALIVGGIILTAVMINNNSDRKPSPKQPVLEKRIEYVEPEPEKYQPEQQKLDSKKDYQKPNIPPKIKPIIIEPPIRDKKSKLEEIAIEDMYQFLDSLIQTERIAVSDYTCFYAILVHN